MSDDVNLQTLTFKVKFNRLLHKTICKKRKNEDFYRYESVNIPHKRYLILSKRWVRKKMRTTKKIAIYVSKNQKQKLSSKNFTKNNEFKVLNSNIISNTIQKYKFMKTIKKVRKNVNLICSYRYSGKNPSIIHDKEKDTISIKQLNNMVFKWKCPVDYEKICIAEINTKYLYITVQVKKENTLNYKKNVGVDLNLKGNLATVANPINFDYKFLGENAINERRKYLEMRGRWQKQLKLLKVKRMGNKENRVMTDVNHKISRDIVNYALKNKSNIKMEDLTGIRNTAKSSRSFKKFLHSWGFYQLRTFVEYKASMVGLETNFVCPRYTSQMCFNCKRKMKVIGKEYVCPDVDCGWIEHRDVNAAFNIAVKESISPSKEE